MAVCRAAARRRLDGCAVLDDDDDADAVLEGERPGLVRRVSPTSPTRGRR